MSNEVKYFKDLGLEFVEGDTTTDGNPFTCDGAAHLFAVAHKMYEEIEYDVQELKGEIEDYPMGSFRWTTLNDEIKRKEDLLKQARGE